LNDVFNSDQAEKNPERNFVKTIYKAKKLKRFITKLVAIILRQLTVVFKSFINHPSKTDVIQYNMNNSDTCDMANSFLLKTKNRKTASNRDPIFAIMELTRLFPKRSNLKSIITMVSVITVNTPIPKSTNPTLTRLQSTNNK